MKPVHSVRPVDLPQLVNYGCDIISGLSYQIVFLGSVWHTPYLANEAALLQDKLRSALQSRALNAVFTQYQLDKKPAITATPVKGSGLVVDMPWSPYLNRAQLQTIAQHLLDRNRLSPPVTDPAAPQAAMDWDNYVLTFVLPPGTILIDSVPPKSLSSLDGSAGVHGALRGLSADSGLVDVFFIAAVWSDGSNGVSMPAFGGNPAWLPRENTCAVLYHEFGEVRTNRNIDAAPRNGMAPPKTVGWTVFEQGVWWEMPDLPNLWAGRLPEKAFYKGTVTETDEHGAEREIEGVTIQAMWDMAPSDPGQAKPFMPDEPGISFTPVIPQDFYYDPQ